MPKLIRGALRLEMIVEKQTDWTRLGPDDRATIRESAVHALAVSRLVHTPMLDEEGALVAAMRDACDHAAVILDVHSH